MENGLNGLIESPNFTLLKARTHRTLAAILGESGLFDESIENYQKAATLFEEEEDFEKCAYSNLTLARVYEKERKP